MSYQLRVIRSATEIDQIAPDWRRLAESSRHALNDPLWYANAARFTHAETDQLSILALWRGTELVALAPLALARGSGGPRYEIVGSRVLYEPAAIVTRDGSATEQMAAAIVALDWPTLLARTPAAGDFSTAFRRCARQRGVVMSVGASGSQWVDLTQGWDGYYASRPSRLKDIIRRNQRQLGKLGRLEFECVRPGPADAERLLEQAFAVEIKSWKGKAGSAVLLREDLRRFFLAYGAGIAQGGQLCVSFLRLDGNPIAMQIANVSHGAYWLLKIGYDEQYSKYRTGWQLQLESIRWCCAQGLGRYEFLGTEEIGRAHV